MEKTHLQHLMIATVINLVRVLAWVDQTPLAKTRISRFGALALAAEVHKFANSIKSCKSQMHA
jgi:hypothetical protein